MQKIKNSQLGCSTNLSAALQIDDKAKLSLATRTFVQMKKCNNYLLENILILSAAVQHCGLELLPGHTLSTLDKRQAVKEGNIVEVSTDIIIAADHK